MRVLLAGASGAIGTEVLRLLRAQGAWVRTLSRDAARAEGLRRLADDVVIADATRESEVARAAHGVDLVVSALGASVGLHVRERRTFRAVDLMANANLLASAVSGGVPRFVYVGVHVAPGYEHTRYVCAHEAFVGRLEAAPIASTVVRPTGVFSALAPLVELARKGRMALIGDGHWRTNPVHPVDVAEAVMRHLADGPRSVSVGGPDVLSRRAIAEAAFVAIGKPARFVELPPPILRLSGGLVGLVHPRLGELLQFAVAVATTDAMGPPVGTRRLGEYFEAIAGRR